MPSVVSTTSTAKPTRTLYTSICVYTPWQQFQQLHGAAQQAGLSLSSFIRQCCNEEQVRAVVARNSGKPCR